MIFATAPKKYESFISQKTVEDDPDDFTERLRKTWYYGNLPGTERPSLAVTDLLVDFYNEAAPRELGKLDNYLAASTARSACISPSSVMAGMMYVKRLKKRRPDYLTQVSSSELFLISMMMASKFLYDEGIDEEVFNDEWATSGDLDTEDVNKLELEFLSAMDWQLFVRQEEFAEMLDQIEKRVALRQGTERGWFTYTDLMVLSQGLKIMNWNDLITELSTVFSATSLAYLAGIFTLVGSTMLGTATSSAMIRAGSSVLPLGFKLLPVLTLTSDLSAEVMIPDSMMTEPLIHMDRLIVSNSNQSIVPDLETEVHQAFRKGSQSDGQEPTHDQVPVSDDLHPDTSKKPHAKDHNGLLNGFLSPFLALLTLKDTLFQFASGANLFNGNDQASNSSDLDSLDTTLNSEVEDRREFCSSGPCLVDSWPYCWNTTGESAWSSYKTSESWSEENPQGHGRLHSSQGHDFVKEKRQCNGCHQRENGAGLQADWLKVSRLTYCCCKVGQTDHLLQNSFYQQAIEDINLRFATRSVFPIFVTT